MRTVTATGGVTGADTYQYDATGNLTKKSPASGAVQDLVWNDEGKLAASTVSGATTAFLYDTEGTRILKREPTATTLYLPGGQELVLTKSTGALSGTRYYAVPGGSAVHTSSDGRVRLLVADHQGTNQLSVSASTLAFNRRKSLPYGAPRGTAPTFWPGQKGFVGGDIDTVSGFTHVGAREYDTTTGRFISVDPVMHPDDPRQMQGYAYANNTPVTQSDPTGLESCYPVYCAGDNGTYGDFKEPTPTPDADPAGSGGTGGTASGSSNTGGATNSGGLGPVWVIPTLHGIIFVNMEEHFREQRKFENQICQSDPISLICTDPIASTDHLQTTVQSAVLDWITGSGAQARVYGDDSLIAGLMARTDKAQEARNKAVEKWLANGKGDLGKLSVYSLGEMSNRELVDQIDKDFNSILGGLQDPNSVKVMLGSFSITGRVIASSPKGIQVRFEVDEDMTVSSAGHLVTGYDTWAEKYVTKPLNSGGWLRNHSILDPRMRDVNQIVTWRETLTF
ncbi:RHS repeat domain-containing protein [Streptomyces sp. NPDC058872]|uniref:RHS repeat domain-containing protein n=1 Tax=Streptomyces sp. NPDC058872 TaxID=3346661 RepID=UPI0036859F1A